MENIQLEKIKESDSKEIEILANSNGGNQDLNEQNITHWYFKNPHKSSSLWKAVMKGKIEGYATTNNFHHHIGDKEYLIAFPQNVLTSNNIRGKGIFKKLYYKTEDENLNQNKVNLFLTFTGEMSTPIFKNKFNFLAGNPPLLLIKLVNPTAFIYKTNYSKIKSIQEVTFDQKIFQFQNGRKKDINYYKWRYSNCDSKKLRILEISDKSETLGYSFLILQKIKGVPMLILADMISKNEESISKIIDESYLYTCRNLIPALIMIDLTYNCTNRGINFKIKQSSTFQVKGKNDEETDWLSKIRFNFFYGDLDYFW